MKHIAMMAGLLLATQVQAQSSLPTAGALVIVAATGQVTHANDEATATFAIEESGRDKFALATRVNQRMKEGTDIVRAQDPSAKLKTQGYYTYPEYRSNKSATSARDIVGWRVGQSLKVSTQNLAALPKMTAAAQGTLGLTGIDFHLSQATSKKLDDLRIAATYQNLHERIAAIASAMGRKVGDATLETVDFDGAGSTLQHSADRSNIVAQVLMAPSVVVSEPSFEPGETTLQMHLVGKVKFK